MVISFAEAHAYLENNLDQNLVLLGALDYEAVESLYGVERDGRLVAIALVLEPPWATTDDLPTVLVTAADSDAIAELLLQADWPPSAVWSVGDYGLLPRLEEQLSRSHDPKRGLLYFTTTTVPNRPHPLVRGLTMEDADQLDLSPCSLSPTALRNWLIQGWRVFGAVRAETLLGHALAAYPIGDTEEVAAVFTAHHERRKGLASAIVAITIADIIRRGRRVVYVSKKANTASRRVATGLGMVPLIETWEIVTNK